jgi:hypothetical protein
VPIAADTAIFAISAVEILQRITVIVPHIVPERMENVWFNRDIAFNDLL